MSRYSKEQLTEILETRSPEAIEAVRRRAEELTLATLGNRVHYRGLIEFSNICTLNCLYCGIRRDNTSQKRYTASHEQIIDAAKWCAEAGYGSVVLQSGERSDENFVSFVEEAVRRIKRETVSETRTSFRRFREAGAHRYLLRIETTNPGLFRRIHPGEQTLESRLECLRVLKEEGFAVGTGVMIGLPGQTTGMLAEDLLFYSRHDFDMFGMGPFIPHRDTPMGKEAILPAGERMRLSLLMIALTRLLTVNTNIAATTALQALDPTGREQGLTYGANILMPSLTPGEYRKSYLLYEGKPCTDEQKEDCLHCLRRRVELAGRVVAVDDWGDPVHYTARITAKEGRST